MHMGERLSNEVRNRNRCRPQSMIKAAIHALSVFATLVVLVCVSACNSKGEQQSAAATIDTIPMMVMQIQKCSKLYTTEHHVHKIVTHNDQMRLKGTFFQKEFNISLPTGDRKIAIPIDATLKSYVDFSQFSEKNIRRKGEKIEIILPDPKVELTSSKIDHKAIKKRVPLLRHDFSDEEMANYEQQGRAAILNDIPRMGILPLAQENAAKTLIPMIEQMGYKQEDITISFRKKFTLEDLPTLLDRNSYAR